MTDTRAAGIDVSSLKYCVLGPLDVASPRGRAKLGGRRQQMVLAVLLSQPNRVVSQDSLIDAVWNGEPPPGGARVLHTYVSTLRRELGEAIGRDGGGYVLRADPEQIDANRFESLVAEARDQLMADPETASELLRRALGLWTGPPYGDLGYEHALVAEANRLAEARLAAHELRFEADLALGRHGEIIGEVEALLADNPYRERLAATLLLALYRAGRQSDALRSYARIRGRLVEEMGIEPGPELQELELKILAQDPALAFPGADGGAMADIHGARGYEIHERVGGDEYGTTYRGFQTAIAREVSVLVIDDPVVNSEHFIRTFPSEMQVVSQLEHPHLAPVFDYWREPNRAVVIMPFYRGGTVETSLQRGPWTLAAALKLSRQLTSALSFLHRQDYGHGAIAASSVALDEDGNAYLTETGLRRLQPQVAPPDVATDVGQLATLLYEVLTLQQPDRTTKISTMRPELPAELDHPIARALHPDHERRFGRIEDFDRALRQSVGLDIAAFDEEPPANFSRRNPYKGLRAFQEPDAADFHGRDALIDAMIETLGATRFLAVVGPSGSGKSSAVRAGLIPRLRSGALPASSEWLITDMFPGTHPFEELEAALVRITADVIPDLHKTLTADRRGLARVVKQLTATNGGEVLLVIDQFEELFSLTSAAADRELFLDSLVAAATEERSGLRIVVTLRADFFDRPLQHPGFAELFEEGLATVTPLSNDGLARAISQPALGVGVTLEPGLVTQVIADVREEPGGLPLLQYALTELFAARESDVLTLAAYKATAGVGGALANRAEAIYSSLSAQGKEATRQLFLRLVTVDELADDTRRRARRNELMQLEVDRAVMVDVIQQFGAYRLLSFDRDAASRAPTVELAHEALLREWGRLRSWVDERREDLLIHRRVHVAAQDWEDAERDSSYLLRGSRLQQALAWLDRTDLAVSQGERGFIDEGQAGEQAEQAERAAIEAKATRRRNLAIAILGAAAVVAGALGVVVAGQRARAAAIEDIAQAGELSQAALAVTAEDPELGVLLAAEALEITDRIGVEPMPAALSALWSNYVANRLELRIPETGYWTLAFSPDGATLAVDSAIGGDGAVRLWDATTGREIGVLPAVSADVDLQVWDIEYSPDGRWVAVLRSQGGRGSSVEVFDVSTGDLARRFVDRDNFFTGIDVSETGLLVAAGWNTELVVWDFSGDKEVLRVPASDDAGLVIASEDVEFVPGTEDVVAGMTTIRETDPTIRAINARSGATAWDHRIDLRPWRIAVDPAGGRIAVASQSDQLLAVYDVSSGESVWEPITHPDPIFVAWSPGGERVAVGGNDSDITILDAGTGTTELILSGHTAAVERTAFAPNGGSIASVAVSGEVRLWNISKAGLPPGSVAFGDEDINYIAVTDNWLVPSLVGVGTTPINRTTGEPEAAIEYVIENGYVTVAAENEDLVAGFTPPSPRGDCRGPHTAALETELCESELSDGSGTIRDLGAGSVAAELPKCGRPIALSADGRIVIMGLVPDCQGSAVPGVYDILSRETTIPFPYDGSDMVFAAVSGLTADGRRFAAVVVAAADSLDVDIWSLDEPRQLGTVTGEFAGGPILLPEFSSDGRYLALGTNGSRALAVDVAALDRGASSEEAVIFNQEVHAANTPYAQVTDDGLIATASFDGFYRFWDLLTGELVWDFEADGPRGSGTFDFSPDFAYFYYEDGDGVVRRMPTDVDEMVALAMSSVTRTLSDDECRRYLHTDGCV